MGEIRDSRGIAPTTVAQIYRRADGRLMHWLHGITGAKRILDLTAGSGTGMYTAFLDGIDWLGAEICPQAIVIAEARLAFWKGLSFDARRAFMEDDVVPEPQRRDERELSLFDGLA